MVDFFEKFFTGRIIADKGWHTVLREVITMENHNNPSNKKQQSSENKKQQSGENKKNNGTPENKNSNSQGY